jgi:pimeloyl-ACP methyl ester carboxylesterase
VRRGFIDTPDGQIHYRDSEAPGDPVIVLHPTPMSARAMLPLINAIAARGYRAIGMDTMGYGDSDRPKTPYTSMSQFAQAVRWLGEGLGYSKVRLVAGLTGSQIALQTAGDHPDFVEALAVQEAFNWGTPSRRAVHARLHYYHPRKPDGGHVLELYQRSAWGDKDQATRERDLNLRDFIYVNEEEGAEVYEGMGWEGAGPWCMTGTVIWDVTPNITAPALITYRKNSELDRALERFLETLPRGKGLRDCPTFLLEADGFADIVVDFFKNPGV